MSDTTNGTGLLRRVDGPVASPGWTQRIEPASAGWTYVGFTALRLAAGSSHREPAAVRERLVLILEGAAEVSVGGAELGVLGSRDSVFEGPPPPEVLVGSGEAIDIRAVRDSLIVVGSAPLGSGRRTALIRPGEIFAETRGSGNTQRRIHHLLPAAAKADHLLAFEVYTPGGNWSSFPPHKHDTEDPPREAYLEELYFYRFVRPTGFAVQRVYTPDGSLDATITARDGDVVLVPRGYHVVGAASGYDCYYLNVMAGPNRAWNFTVDPDHRWLMDWDPTRPKGS